MKHHVSLPEGLFPVVLVGLPGCGKTSVARDLSRLIGGVDVDLDSEIKRRTRCSIAEVFATRGEEGFRDIETATLRHALATSHGVIAAGGGVVVRAENRRLLASRIVVHLEVSPEEAARRIGEGRSGRPLLDDADEGVVGELTRLAAERDRHYRQVATVSVPTDGLRPGEVAMRCFAALREFADSPAGRRWRTMGGPEVHEVTVGKNPGYRVLIGAGIHGEVARCLRPATRRVLLVHPQALARQARDLTDQLSRAHVDTSTFVHPEGEEAKTLDVVSQAWGRLEELGFTREDAIVSLGGGATTDMAGFVAATWLRGIDHVCCPTSLLGMVDAAVGGKTGINTALGKNLIGSFYAPRAVIADVTSLQSLPEAEFRSGLGEVIKCGFIADPHILALVDSADPQDLVNPSGGVVSELIARSVEVKARVVTSDFAEAGQREILNYGHTFAHAIEYAEGYRVRHGDAVAQGMVFAAHVAEKMGIGPDGLVEATRERVAKAGLPTHYAGADFATLYAAMGRDKKVRGDHIRMVLIDDIGHARVVPIASRDVLERAYEAQASGTS
ncbi:MAG: 3-dehydroquinate synthase [Actinomycetaceae bacterium]|nr:3-dehydroquinate synthase [Actinomycetaceae bacterium]